MKRMIVIFILALVLLSSGCSMQGLPLFHNEKSLDIVLRIPENTHPIVDSAITDFLGTLSQTFGGKITTNIYNESSDFFYQDSSYDIAIISKKELEKISPSFQIVNTPLFFPSLDFMNLSLNSKPILSFLNNVIQPIHKATALGFFYAGHDIFASTLSADSNLQADLLQAQANKIKNSINLITTSTSLANTLDKIGIATTLAENTSDATLLFNTGSSENNTIHLPFSNLMQLEKQPNITLVDGFVTPNYYCVIVSNSFYEALSDSQRAVLKQGLATLYASITDQMVKDEQLLLSQASVSLDAPILFLNQNPLLLDDFYNTIFTNQIISQEIFTELYLIFSAMR